MGGWDAYLIKTDLNGNIVWSKNYGGFDNDWFSSIQLTHDGGYIACGTTFTFGSGIGDVYLLKLDPAGNIQWTKTFGGSGWERGNFVQQTFDNGFIITGYSTSFTAASGRIYLLKTDSLGNVSWSKIFGGVMGEEGFCAKQCSDSGYIVTGYTNSFGTGLQEVFLIKTNDNGNLSWMKTYGNISIDLGYYVDQTPDNGFIIAARTYSFGQADYLIKTNAYGDTLWSKAYPGQAGLGHFVLPTNDGGYILASSSNVLKLIKTDSMGNSGCNELIPNTIVTIASPVILSGAITNSGGATVSSATITRYTSIIIDTLCLTTGVNNYIDNKELNIYPNPATNQLHVKLTKPITKNTTLTITDMQGRLVQEYPHSLEEGPGGEVINISTLSQGIYLLKLNGQVQRFVKM